jgi:hypothetical protein
MPEAGGGGGALSTLNTAGCSAGSQLPPLVVVHLVVYGTIVVRFLDLPPARHHCWKLASHGPRGEGDRTDLHSGRSGAIHPPHPSKESAPTLHTL